MYTTCSCNMRQPRVRHDTTSPNFTLISMWTRPSEWMYSTACSSLVPCLASTSSGSAMRLTTLLMYRGITTAA